MKRYPSFFIGAVLTIVAAFLALVAFRSLAAQDGRDKSPRQDPTATNAVQLVSQGREIFRFDTFGDEAFWGDVLQLHTVSRALQPAVSVLGLVQKLPCSSD